MRKISIAFISGLFLLFLCSFITEEPKQELYPELNEYINKILKEINKIPNERKAKLNELVTQINYNRSIGLDNNLLFICTHNSRRSHMAQIWCQTAAYYYKIDNINCYSGGTEISAFNPRAINVLKDAGFRITKNSEQFISYDSVTTSFPSSFTPKENPVFDVRFSDSKNPILAFSKKYEHASNPINNFCAIMTCSQADKECPIVAGASTRISIPYEDPRLFDNTKNETSIYQERCKQIAIEMFYILSLIK